MFDPSRCSQEQQFYWAPIHKGRANIILFSVPDATARSKEPLRLLNVSDVSYQLDLFDWDYEDAWHMEYMEDTWWFETDKWSLQNVFRSTYRNVRTFSDYLLEQINEGCTDLNECIRSNRSILNGQKLIGLIGGEHSVPFGYIKSLVSGIRRLEFFRSLWFTEGLRRYGVLSCFVCIMFVEQPPRYLSRSSRYPRGMSWRNRLHCRVRWNRNA